MEKRWNVVEANPQEVYQLQNELKIHPALCRILVSRGITNFESAHSFFRPNIEHLHDPFMMKGMDAAAGRIIKACHNRESILVYGDYDVDGTTAVAIMVRFLSSIGCQVDYYVPHRYREGYGISKQGIEYAIKQEVQLIITVDCGIKALHQIEEANHAGIDAIICDHHLPGEELPQALAILNPKQKDCHYPFKELCGCGVALKLIQAICKNLNLPDSYWTPYLQLTAAAIAADIVPIVGENRILAFYGLQEINERPLNCLKALLKLSNHTGEVHINTLVFAIAPRVNAAGRMDDARKAIQLFLEDDFEAALSKAELLQEDNSDRKEADSSITEEALQQLVENDPESTLKASVVYNENWHKGVVGIVASRLTEIYYRPTVVLTKSGDKISGSARSVSGYNLYEAIDACAHLLDSYGGHFFAAGLTMPSENLEAFKAFFEQYVASSITPEQLIPEINIDAKINFEDIRHPFYNIITQMEPYGPQNMRPVFASTQVFETGNSRIVKENHLKVSLKQHNTVMHGIGFGLADKAELLKPNQPLDIAYTLDVNEWQGNSYLQMKVLDIRLAKEHDWVGH